MNLNLTKPICFFDLETTGVNITTDRIVEIAILKVHPNGKEESKTWLVNPEIPIPAEVVAIHGITNEKVANAVIAFKESMNTEVLEKAAKVEEIGYQNYLNLKK